MIVVLLGPPGAGKGTQAARLAAEAGLTHVSTGEVFRDHLRQGTPLGQRGSEFMTRGELVPDDVVVEMVKDTLREIPGGVVLDGFPRTVPQADALDTLADAERGEAPREIIAVELRVPRDELLRRLTGRRVCADVGHIYHTAFNPPRQPGVCDIDGSTLFQRDDDSETTVLRRLEVYEEESGPVAAFYSRTGRLVTVDGTGDPDDVHSRLLKAVHSPTSPQPAGLP